MTEQEREPGTDYPAGSAEARAYAAGQRDARTGRGLSLSAPAAVIAAYLAGAKAGANEESMKER